MPSLDKCSYVLLCGGSSSPRELITKVGISLKLEASASFLKFPSEHVVLVFENNTRSRAARENCLKEMRLGSDSAPKFVSSLNPQFAVNGSIVWTNIVINYAVASPEFIVEIAARAGLDAGAAKLIHSPEADADEKLSALLDDVHINPGPNTTLSSPSQPVSNGPLRLLSPESSATSFSSPSSHPPLATLSLPLLPSHSSLNAQSSSSPTVSSSVNNPNAVLTTLGSPDVRPNEDVQSADGESYEPSFPRIDLGDGSYVFSEEEANEISAGWREGQGFVKRTKEGKWIVWGLTRESGSNYVEGLPSVITARARTEGQAILGCAQAAWPEEKKNGFAIFLTFQKGSALGGRRLAWNGPAHFQFSFFLTNISYARTLCIEGNTGLATNLQVFKRLVESEQLRDGTWRACLHSETSLLFFQKLDETARQQLEPFSSNDADIVILTTLSPYDLKSTLPAAQAMAETREASQRKLAELRLKARTLQGQERRDAVGEMTEEFLCAMEAEEALSSKLMSEETNGQKAAMTLFRDLQQQQELQLDLGEVAKSGGSSSRRKRVSLPAGMKTYDRVYRSSAPIPAGFAVPKTSRPRAELPKSALPSSNPQIQTLAISKPSKPSLPYSSHDLHPPPAQASGSNAPLDKIPKRKGPLAIVPASQPSSRSFAASSSSKRSKTTNPAEEDSSSEPAKKKGKVLQHDFWCVGGRHEVSSERFTDPLRGLHCCRLHKDRVNGIRECWHCLQETATTYSSRALSDPDEALGSVVGSTNLEIKPTLSYKHLVRFHKRSKTDQAAWLEKLVKAGPPSKKRAVNRKSKKYE